MKQTIIELDKKLKELSDKSTNFIKAMDALALIGFEDVEKKRKMIDDLRQMERKVGEKRQNVIDAISALQKCCTHTNPDGSSTFKYSGHDSHYSYEKCDICGKEQKK